MGGIWKWIKRALELGEHAEFLDSVVHWSVAKIIGGGVTGVFGLILSSAHDMAGIWVFLIGLLSATLGYLLIGVFRWSKLAKNQGIASQSTLKESAEANRELLSQWKTALPLSTPSDTLRALRIPGDITAPSEQKVLQEGVNSVFSKSSGLDALLPMPTAEFMPMREAAQKAYTRFRTMKAEIAGRIMGLALDKSEDGILDYTAGILLHRLTLYGKYPGSTELEKLESIVIQTGRFEDGARKFVARSDTVVIHEPSVLLSELDGAIESWL